MNMLQVFNSIYHIWGDHPTKVFPKVSPIAVFTSKNDVALEVSGHLDKR